MTDKSQLEIRVDRERVKLFTVGGLGKRPPCYVTNTCPQSPDDLNQADDGPGRPAPAEGGHAPGRRGVHRRAAREARGSAAVHVRPSGSSTARISAARWCSRWRSGTVQRPDAGRHAEPPRDLRLPARPASATRPLCRARSLAAGAPRVPAAGDQSRRRRADAVLSRRARQRRTFDRGIERAPQRHPRRSGVPVPHRARSRASVKPGAAYRLSDLELASRLSFFLWSSIPDESCSIWRREAG